MKQLFTKIALSALLVLATAFALSAQNVAISGTVTDQAGPVIGAAVMIPGTTVGTTTDVDGHYSLNAPKGATIAVSSIGYKTYTFTVGDAKVYDVVLEEDTEMIEETVVVGYGVQRKSDVTGAIASVREGDLSNRSTSDAANALQGKAAGVQILNLSAAPGAGSTIRVRGYSSNSGNLGPLLIVDGLQVDNIQYLDPSMIESMEVLKDAASAAIYGAQAGNGVVLITTKSGSKSKDGSVFYNFQYTINSLARHAEMMNAEQYIAARKAGNLISDETLANAGYNGTDTNWQDVVFGNSATQRHTVGFSGSNDRANFYLAINNVTEDGIVKGDKDVYKRLGVQMNAEYKVKKWLTVGTNTSIERYYTRSVSQHSENASVLGPALTNDPLTKPYLTYEELPLDVQGILAAGTHRVFIDKDTGLYYGLSKIVESDGGGNPLAQRDRDDSFSQGVNIRGTVYGNFTPFKDLVFTSRFGYRIRNAYSTSYTEPYYINSQQRGDTYSLSGNSSTGIYYQWENFANYTKKLGKNVFSAMAGMSYIENNSENVSASASGADILTGYKENFRYLDFVKTDAAKDISGSQNTSSSLSYFGRIGWNYADRYNVQVNFRADAYDSSKLSKQNRWGYFPSVSAGWNITNEEFMKGIDKNKLSSLRLRASWGRNGNISVLSGYPYTTSIDVNAFFYQYTDGSSAMDYGSGPSGLANPNLKWETSEQIDLGLDARLFNNKLSVGIDYYNKKTKDLLVSIAPPREIGVSRTTVNAGSVLNQGLEIEATWRDKIGDFNYSISGNLSTLKNEVTYLDPSISRITGSSLTSSKMQTRFEVGYPVWYIAGFKYEGIDSEGNAIIADIDDNNVIDDNDRTMIGCGIPDFTYGITFNAEYKGFDLTIFGTGTQGNDIFACFYRTDRPLYNSLATFWENSYDVKGASAKYPAIAPTVTDNSFWSSDASIFDGSFFKIKQIQLGYTLPTSITKKVSISNLRLFVSMDDYFCFSSYPGLDPETATAGSASSLGIDKGSYPTSKKALFGVNITF